MNAVDPDAARPDAVAPPAVVPDPEAAKKKLEKVARPDEPPKYACPMECGWSKDTPGASYTNHKNGVLSDSNPMKVFSTRLQSSCCALILLTSTCCCT